jgi:hypothetical protein
MLQSLWSLPKPAGLAKGLMRLETWRTGGRKDQESAGAEIMLVKTEDNYRENGEISRENVKQRCSGLWMSRDGENHRIDIEFPTPNSFSPPYNWPKPIPT